MKYNFKNDWPLYLIILGVGVVVSREALKSHTASSHPETQNPQVSQWTAPSFYYDHTLEGEEREMVIYGSELISHTSKYFGPRGTVLQITNGMNCQNCHLNEGKLHWGNNYSAVYATYPKFRDRSGSIETIAKRINDCFERSLNGKSIDTSGKEMKAILSYIRWLGKDVEKGKRPEGAGIRDLNYLDRAADPQKGKAVFVAKCQRCHGTGGEGVKDANGLEYTYPPLWGEHSYNTGAGLYRLSRFAGFVKDNMPFGESTQSNPQLTDEEAWDVAAFVNSQPRPQKDLTGDWPDISKKPFDHPFGPYHDGFDEAQHKYGPFMPILEARKKLKEKEALAHRSPN